MGLTLDDKIELFDHDLSTPVGEYIKGAGTKLFSFFASHEKDLMEIFLVTCASHFYSDSPCTIEDIRPIYEKYKLIGFAPYLVRGAILFMTGKFWTDTDEQWKRYIPFVKHLVHIIREEISKGNLDMVEIFKQPMEQKPNKNKNMEE